MMVAIGGRVVFTLANEDLKGREHTHTHVLPKPVLAAHRPLPR